MINKFRRKNSFLPGNLSSLYLKAKSEEEPALSGNEIKAEYRGEALLG